MIYVVSGLGRDCLKNGKFPTQVHLVTVLTRRYVTPSPGLAPALTCFSSGASTQNTAGDLPIFCSVTMRTISTPTEARPKSRTLPAIDIVEVPLSPTGGGAEVVALVVVVLPRFPGGTKRQRVSCSLPETSSTLS